MLTSTRLNPILAVGPKVAINAISVRTSFYNRYKHGPTKATNPSPDYYEFLKEFFRGGAKEFIKETYQDFKQFLNETLFHGYKGRDLNQLRIFEHFDNDEFLKRWKPVADSTSANGYSTCQLTKSEAGHALFQGYLDNKIPEDGVTMKSGFVALMGPRRKRTFQFGRQKSWNWDGFNSFEIRFRGDGRKYTLILNTADWNNDLTYYDIYCYPLHTRGGPHWETRVIPFSKFIFASKGLLQRTQSPLMPQTVKFVAITLNDNIDGPFRFEIDYMGLELRNFGITERFAYEGYHFDHIRYRQILVGVDPPDDN